MYGLQQSWVSRSTFKETAKKLIVRGNNFQYTFKVQIIPKTYFFRVVLPARSTQESEVPAIIIGAIVWRLKYGLLDWISLFN